MPVGRWHIPILAFTAMLLGPGCTQPAPVNTQDAIANAVDDDLHVVDADDDRADHLDEKAAELLAPSQLGQ